MDGQFPHQTLSVKTGKNQKGKNLEGKTRKSLKGTSSLPVPHSLPCPQLCVDKDEMIVLKAQMPISPSLKLGKTHATFPVPLFPPFMA